VPDFEKREKPGNKSQKPSIMPLAKSLGQISRGVFRGGRKSCQSGKKELKSSRELLSWTLSWR
jgi:hypothetical protein